MAGSNQVTATARSVSGILRAAGFSATCVTEGDVITIALDWPGRTEDARALLDGRGIKVRRVILSRGWLFLERGGS